MSKGKRERGEEARRDHQLVAFDPVEPDVRRLKLAEGRTVLPISTWKFTLQRRQFSYYDLKIRTASTKVELEKFNWLKTRHLYTKRSDRRKQSKLGCDTEEPVERFFFSFLFRKSMRATFKQI